ncbi:hypothetical protein [Bacillus subtilis]|uniref:hypothetical protein n=1 Tax=Bacillus subtilis TaxID=1423 RepID=UPI000D777BFD|nr:hypothetical protein [Bacillus subtilis]AWM23011.1 hypothetical protein DJ572_20635 [Bacillus subtilis]QAW14545.1 hypothetical protein ETA10_21655 [Bacillus subtilis]WBU34496.1 hypothetical protein OSK17_22265 [Bacillus subtilis]
MQIDWSTVISVSIPLLAATSGQIIAHQLTRKREKQKHNKECFQNLYSPIMFLINDYISAEALKVIFMREENYSEEEFEKEAKDTYFNPNRIFGEILNLFSLNLKYASHGLISEFYDVKVLFQMEKLNEIDNHGIEHRIEFIYRFLQDYLKAAKKLGIVLPRKFNSDIFYISLYKVLDNCICTNLSRNLINDHILIDHLSQNEILIKKSVKILKHIELNNSKRYNRKKVYLKTFAFLDELCNDIDMFVPDIAKVWRTEIETAKSHKLNSFYMERR